MCHESLLVTRPKIFGKYCKLFSAKLEILHERLPSLAQQVLSDLLDIKPERLIRDTDHELTTAWIEVAVRGIEALAPAR